MKLKKILQIKHKICLTFYLYRILRSQVIFLILEKNKNLKFYRYKHLLKNPL